MDVDSDETDIQSVESFGGPNTFILEDDIPPNTPTPTLKGQDEIASLLQKLDLRERTVALCYDISQSNERN